MTTGIRTFGIDVSHYNEQIDWDAAVGPAAPGKVHFCFAKASQLYFDKHGQLVHQHDAQFDRNWRELTRLKLPKGAYHYCMPEFSAQDMADLFFSVYTPQKGDLIPSLDVEDEYVRAIASGKKTRKELVGQILEFGDIVRTKIGREPFIYIRKDITDALGNPPEFESYPLWIANYNTPATPALPKPWNDYAFWQYTPVGTWPGFPSTPTEHNDVDMNYLNGAPAQLANYLI